MLRKLQKLFTGLSSEILSSLFLDKVLLTVGPVIITVVLGYFNGVIWFYIWIGALASIAFVFHSLLKMTEWFYKIGVEHKIAISGVSAHNEINSGGYCVQIQLASIANFPIDIEFDDFRFQLEDKVPKDNDGKMSITIPPHGTGWRNTRGIVLEVSPSSGVIKGHLDFSIKYGRNKNLKYTLQNRIGVILIFNENGVLTHSNWHEMNV